MLGPKPETCQNPGIATTINLVNYPLPNKEAGLEGVVKKWTAKYKKMDSVNIIEQGYVTKGDSRYYKIVFTRNYKDVRVVKFEDRYYLKGDKYYVLDFNSNLVGFEEHQIRATQILDSFMLR